MQELVPQLYAADHARRLFKREKVNHRWEIQLGTTLHVLVIELDKHSSQLRVSVDGRPQVDALYYGKYLSKYTVWLGSVAACILPANEGEFDVMISNESCLALFRSHQSAFVSTESTQDSLQLESIELVLE